MSSSSTSESHETSSSSIDEMYYHGDKFHGTIIKSLKNVYYLVKRIDVGGFSSIWLAYNMAIDKFYVIKISIPEYYEEGKLERETLQNINKLNNSNLIKLIEDFTYQNGTDKHICLVFEIFACNLYQLIRRGKYKDGLPQHVVDSIIEQIENGLKDLHDKNKLYIVHCDIKPENILLRGTNRKTQKIIDEYRSYDIRGIIKKLISKKAKQKGYDEQQIKKYFKKNKKLKQRLNLVAHQYILKKMNLITIDEDDDVQNISDDDHDEPVKVDDKFIMNPEIVITDFGLIKEMRYYDDEEDGYTEYYRNPECILKMRINYKYDYWSLACTEYELLTGKVLFKLDDDEKDKNVNEDIYHLKMIENFCSVKLELPANIRKKVNRTKVSHKSLKKDLLRKLKNSTGLFF